jgi:hypothetical protein
VANIGPWAVRATWLVLALAAGPAFADALAGTSRPVQVVASVGLWAGWAAVLAAALVPRASSLTVVRAAAPAALVATVAAAVHGPSGGDDAVAVAAAIATVAAAWAAPTTDAFVDGSSYGNERRFGLRTPVALLLGPVPVAWLLAVALPAVAALLLAAQRWVLGGTGAIAAVAGVRLGVPALHRLSRRWLVLVPAGLVVHDHVALPDPILFRRPTLAGIEPATAGDEGTVDLTLGTFGLPVALSLRAPTEIPVATGSGPSRAVETTTAERVLVAPVRPGAFLAAAGEADLPRPRPGA